MDYYGEQVFQSAQKLIRDGQTDRAAGLLQKVVAKHPRDAQGILRIANLFHNNGMKEDATRTFEHLAGYYSERGEHQKAISLFKQVMKSGETPALHRALAGEYEKLGHHAERDEHNERASLLAVDIPRGESAASAPKQSRRSRKSRRARRKPEAHRALGAKRSPKTRGMAGFAFVLGLATVALPLQLPELAPPVAQEAVATAEGLDARTLASAGRLDSTWSGEQWLNVVERVEEVILALE
jgi:tetratricopeptide (TPR) repeat protein